VYRWEYTTSGEDRVEPIVPDTFTLRFNGNRVELETDCNAAGGVFVTEPLPATTFTVEPLVATSRFCESTQEDDYFAMVEAITAYTETEDGQLTFTLADGREMVFVPRERALEFGS
jgi:heat shock protein HslJ